MICLRMGKTYTAKTPLGDFKVTTPENSIFSQQAVIIKEIPVPFTNLQLNPYLNIQLHLFCSDNLSFQCTAPSTWLTNSMRRSQYKAYLPTRWRSWNSLVTKPYDVQTQQLFKEKDELGHISLIHNMLVKNFCIELHQLWRPLK